MALSDLKVFSQYIKETTIETVAQEIEKFNAASNGAIVLSATGFDGDFLQESMFASLHAAQRRVDRYAANGAASSTSLAEIQDNSVKVAGGFGPILWEPAQFDWIRQNEAAAIEAISRNLSEAIMKDQLNTGIASAVAAISNVAGLVNDVSATGAVTYTAMNDAHAKFGDRSMALVASIMNGATYHKLVGQNLANATRLFEANGVMVVDILGKATIVTDAPALLESGTPNKAKVLSLASGGIVVSDAGNLLTNIEQSNGKLRIETTMQADYDFGIGLKGYAWDTANGGKSPTDAELATGTNWDKYVTSDKDTAGVLTIGDADA
jgi:hypothetical protein